jgi:hypothetical protein
MYWVLDIKGQTWPVYIVDCFPVGDNNAVKRPSKKSSVSEKEETYNSKQKVDKNSNSFKQLKFQIKPSDSIQTDFR